MCGNNQSCLLPATSCSAPPTCTNGDKRCNPTSPVVETWTNPQADSNFTGYYTAFDKFADTVPSPVQANFTTNKQVIPSNTADGIWVFHIVNRDTRNAITKKASHFVVYVGQWELTASKTGYTPQKKMVSLVAGTSLTENFTLTAAP